MTQEKQSDEQYSLISLSPKNNLYDSTDEKTKKEYSYYKSILDDALTDKNNTNVAISGKYGSGKSSLIYSYFKDEESNIDDESVLKINFSNLNKNSNTDNNSENSSTVNDENNETEDNDNGNVLETKLVNEISLSIINQIIYQIDYNKIPLTYFKTKNRRSVVQTISTLLALVFALLLIFLHWINFINNMITTFIIGTFIVSFGVSIYKFIRDFDIKKVKIGFKNIEANINYENDDFFEKYVDEIIYLFTGFENEEKSRKFVAKKSKKDVDEKSKKDVDEKAKKDVDEKAKKGVDKNYVLLIEDLDRFNDTEIFRKLKNLNIKLNHKSNNHWVFLYLIKDDLFKSSTERTKFFDLIVPVIPFITTSNSYDKLKELFKDDEIEDNLLFYVSQFIDDYRLLLNIKNEYEVFKRVTTSGKNNKELFSLIVYKNIYPNEFDETENGKGILANIINNYKANIDEQINDIEKEEEDKLVKLTQENNLQFKRDANSDELYNVSSERDADVVIKQNWLIVDNNKTFKYADIGNYFDNYKNNYVENVHDNLSKLSNYDLSSINQKVISDDVKKNENYDEKEFNFIFGLIKEKSITINYLRTINHFYGNNSDNNFMRSLINRKDNFDIYLPLYDIKFLLTKIKDNIFLLDREQILNCDLFKYALDNDKKLVHKMIKVAKTVNKDSNGYHFIEKFISSYNNYVDEIYNADHNILLYVSDMTLNDDALIKIIKYNTYLDDDVDNKFILGRVSKFGTLKILDIINTNDVNLSLKKKIIGYLDKIDFSKVNNKELWNELIKKDKIAPTFDNIMTYHNEMEESSEDFYKFINKVDIPYKKIEDESDEKNFINSLIFNNNITVGTVKEIISHLNLDIVSSEKAIELNNNKFQLLLDYKLIDLKNNDILNYIANNPIDVSKYNQYVEIANNLDSRYDNDDKVEVKNEKLLNYAINKYDLKSFKFVSRRLDLIKSLDLVDYLKNMKGNLNSYKNDLNKLIRIINNEKGCFNMRVKNDSNGIILNIAEFMKSEKYISGYDITKNNKIKFYK